MRLINVATLDLEEYFGEDIPRYAILSHTWEKDEVSFQEWQLPHRGSHKSGYSKIMSACAQAMEHRLNYLWVDTICIDKTSSAELSEAINSMFAWYRNSTFCYAYLVDVSDVESLCSSRWFTRGWTLQELLAPRKLRFYSCDWDFLGKRSDLSIEVAQITGIRHAFVMGSPVQRASVAERMSWLSRRKTTRVEDMAYCMLGIFDLNIPLLYGEGPKAFLRLQEEIIRVSNDHSIFCWSWIPPHVPKGWRSVIAPSPAVFEHSMDYKGDSWIGTPAYTITNAGLSISLPLAYSATETLASLPIVDTSSSSDSIDMYKTIAIPLAYDDSHELYYRSPYPPRPVRMRTMAFTSKKHIMVDARNSPRNGVFKHEPTNLAKQGYRHGVLLILPPSIDRNCKFTILTINGKWDSSTGTFWLEKVGGDDLAAGVLSFPLVDADNKSKRRRLNILFAVCELKPGIVKPSVHNVDLSVEDPVSLTKWPLQTEKSLQAMVQDPAFIAKATGDSWRTTMYSTEAGMTVDINPPQDCFKSWGQSLVSICSCRPGSGQFLRDVEGKTRWDLHRT
jgi:hypothetical protein